MTTCSYSVRLILEWSLERRNPFLLLRLCSGSLLRLACSNNGGMLSPAPAPPLFPWPIYAPSPGPHYVCTKFLLKTPKINCPRIGLFWSNPSCGCGSSTLQPYSKTVFYTKGEQLLNVASVLIACKIKKLEWGWLIDCSGRGWKNYSSVCCHSSEANRLRRY